MYQLNERNMTYTETLKSLKHNIMATLTEKAMKSPLVINNKPYACFRVLNGALKYENTNGFHNPSEIFTLDELAEFADKF